MRRFPLIFSFFGLMTGGVSTFSFASIDQSQTQDNSLSTFHLENRHSQIQIEIDQIKKEIKSKTRLFHNLKSGASSPLFAWETEAVVEKKRKHLIPYLKIEIKEKLKRLEFLESQLDEVQYDLDLSKISTEQLPSLGEKITLAKNASHFVCQVVPSEPLSGQMVLMQGFGAQKDIESGLKWNSSGWWITHISGPVKVCSKGTVVFDGKIQGRGRVVMIDHGNSMLSLYANLSEENNGVGQATARIFQKGDRVDAGSILGNAKEKFYFELRKEGQAIDPRFALKSDHLAKFKL